MKQNELYIKWKGKYMSLLNQYILPNYYPRSPSSPSLIPQVLPPYRRTHCHIVKSDLPGRRSVFRLCAVICQINIYNLLNGPKMRHH